HTPPPCTYTLSLHDALPIFADGRERGRGAGGGASVRWIHGRVSRHVWSGARVERVQVRGERLGDHAVGAVPGRRVGARDQDYAVDRKSTRLNSSHVSISYAV